jgi:molybdopterin molybdotransferase
MISYDEAYRLTLERIQALEAEDVPLVSAVGRNAASDLNGQVDSPSADVSLKDGYAVHSADITAACADSPVTLQVIGMITAGSLWQEQIGSGKAVRILSGAPIPDSADTVVAEEFTQLAGDALHVTNDAHPGRNILRRGSDVRCEELLVEREQPLDPPAIGLLAAAGYQFLPVTRLPRVAILATGDEVVAPGEPLQAGKLYASNLVTLAAWSARYGFAVETFVARDDETLIREKLLICLQDCDVVLTSGGAWSGERDLVVRLLDELGWEKIYHRVRIGPGKAVAFGLYAGKPVFCLPGGPPSNHMAFLQLALPGLRKMSGARDAGLPVRRMRLAESVNGQSDWTQFVHGRLEKTSDLPLFYPLKQPSRLQMLSSAEAIVKIPEGQALIEQGQVVEGQLLKGA